MEQVVHGAVISIFPKARLEISMQSFAEWEAETGDSENTDTGNKRPQRFADDISLVIAAYMKAANLGIGDDFSDDDKAACLDRLVGS